jgi:hypothetical protein
MLMDKQNVDQKVYISAVLKNLKDFLGTLFSSLDSTTYTVHIENQETKLFKEIAENTRGIKGRLDTIIIELQRINEEKVEKSPQDKATNAPKTAQNDKDDDEEVKKAPIKDNFVKTGKK